MFPVADIRRNGKENMVSGKKPPFLRRVKAEMARRMAWRPNRLKVYAAIVQFVTVFKVRVAVKRFRSFRLGRIDAAQAIRLFFRKAVLDAFFVALVSEGRILEIAHDRTINAADVNPAPITVQERRLSRMVIVDVGQKDICPRKVHADSGQFFYHGLTARFFIEARIDEKVALSCNEIAVEGL